MKKLPVNAIVSAALTISFAVLPAVAQTYNGAQLQGRVTYVPSGTTLDTVLASPIDSSLAKPGDIFTAKLYAPLYVGTDVALPANTIFEGQITSADKSGHAGVNGKINMRLTAAITPEGFRYPLSAIIATTQSDKKVTEDKSGDLKGESTKKSVATGVARVAAWTAGGTLLGIIFAPIVAGSVGIGAIAGVASGGAIGLGSDLWRKGKDVKIASGTRVQFSLDQPMAMSPGLASVAQPYR